MTTERILDEDELHGLVDGILDARRQSDLAVRLKSHHAEAARVALWREQSDLIRATFSEVAAEPVPLSLRLTATPRLHCVTTNTSSSAIVDGVEPVHATTSMRYRSVAVLIALGCFTLSGSWLIWGRPRSDAAAVRPHGIADLDTPLRLSSVIAMPTTTIPDLGKTGFTFVGANVRTGEPSSIVFSYVNARSAHLILTVSRTTAAGEAVSQAHAVTWRQNGRSFVLDGTIGGNDLVAIADLIRSEDESGVPD